MRKQLILTSLLLPLFACGGGSSASVETGIFTDSRVINIGYRTETQSGVTNSQGEYFYLPGETVTFFIGDLDLPSTKAIGVVTPLSLVNTQDTSNSTVVNILRLLQTLDKDGNLDNGIEITDIAKSNATLIDFTLDVASFETLPAVDALVMNGGQDSGGTPLISAEDAINHFEQTVSNLGVIIAGTWRIDGSPGDWSGIKGLTHLTLLPNGTYYLSEIGALDYIDYIDDFRLDLELESSEFEFGTYSFSDGILSTTAIFDTDSNSAFSSTGEQSSSNKLEPYDNEVISNDASLNQVSFIIRPSSEAFPLFVYDEGPSGSYILTRLDSSTSIGGAWLNDDALFVFDDYTGRYIVQQLTEEADGTAGIEWGVYNFNGSTLTITPVAHNNELLCGSPNCEGISISASIINDTLTVSIPGKDDIVLNKKI